MNLVIISYLFNYHISLFIFLYLRNIIDMHLKKVWLQVFEFTSIIDDNRQETSFTLV